MDERKKSLITSVAIGAVIAVAVFALGFSRDYGVMRCVSDGMFVAAVVLIGVGGIKWVVGRGAFDTVGYGLSSVLHTHLPSAFGRKETIDEYRERKEKGRKPASPQLLAGILYLILSIIAMLLYYSI